MVPTDLGFPPHFDSFRPAQLEGIEHILTSDKRFTAVGAPPGVGKSGIAVALGRLLPGRTVILTATLGLQDQYCGTFKGMVTDMRGRSHFRCWEGGTCEDGGRLGCGVKDGCPYLGKLKTFNQSEIGVTSYAWSLSAKNTQAVDTLICDEAGLAPDWLSRSLDFTFTEKECREAKVEGFDPLPGEDIDGWVKRYGAMMDAATWQFERAKSNLNRTLSASARDKALQALDHADKFLASCERLSDLNADNWTIERSEGTDVGRVWKFECVWPGRYREKLFKGISRVILMSATLRPKTLGLLGVPWAECDFREWPRQFPAINGPVVWIPTARVGYKMSEEQEREWLGRIRQILNWGSDRKGLVHTVSFARARKIADALDGYRLILNGAADPDSANGREAYQKFLKAPAGSTLVSPSFSTGWDFPLQTAEWQVISKIAFPDARSKVMQTRIAKDRGYLNYLAAQDLVQGCGRIVRSDEDRGMTFLIDDQWTWFHGAAEEYLPKWFKVRREDSLPRPLPKII